MKKVLFYGWAVSLALGLTACSNNRNGEQDTLSDTNDTNFSDSRRNSLGTSNTITGDSTATMDSAQHGGPGSSAPAFRQDQ
ncbi:MAG TPA: hypothetical protein VM843_07840 [Flavisolibacter sp.]|nr:hypothetical protein [Flavisolibacter sp.]